MIPKFRAWDKEEKCWIKIASMNFDEDGELWYLGPVMDDFNPVYYENELGKTWELMQSTGLKDKNDVEIFEGDILKRKFHVTLLGTDLNEWVEETYLVEWKYGGWHIGEDLLDFVLASGVDGHSGCYQTALEVIGNIYENPEFLDN